MPCMMMKLHTFSNFINNVCSECCNVNTLCGMLNFDAFVLSKISQWNEGQAMVLKINILRSTDSCLDSDYLSCEKKLDHMTNASESYNKLAHKTWANCKICKIYKILHRLNYSDFYFVQYQCNVIIVLEAHFNWLFLKQSIFYSIL